MNMELYDVVRHVPDNAKKQIGGGRLKGMTDINPMWRIQTLTEQFGMCGFGWRYEITDKRIEAGANGEKAGFVDINLYVKVGDEWSAAIPGTGGSAFVANERQGLYTSDEVFKMALTDAISVACKALGFGADVYWQAGRTKYTAESPQNANNAKTVKDTAQAPNTPKNATEPALTCVCSVCGKPIKEMTVNGKTYTAQQTALASFRKYGKELCEECRAAADKT